MKESLDAMKESKLFLILRNVKTNPDKNNYENHMKRKFSCVKTVLKCEKCDKIFKEKKSFEFHVAKKYV